MKESHQSIIGILIETTQTLDKAKELIEQQNKIINEQREQIELMNQLIKTIEELNDINKKILPQPNIN